MSEKVLMQDLIDALAREKAITKREAEIFIKTLFDLIKEALKNDQYIKIKGLGTFKLIGINSRESINVNTGERFIIEGHTRISFIPDPSMRDLINKPFAHFETVVLKDDVEFSDTPQEEETENDENFEGESSPAVTNLSIATETEDQTISESNTEAEETSGGELEKTEPLLEEKEEINVKNDQDYPSESGPEPSHENQLIEKNSQTENMKPEDKQGLPYFIAVVAMIIVVLSGTIIYVYNPKILLNLLPASSRQNTAATDSIRQPEIPDSLEQTKSVGNTLVKDSAEMLSEPTDTVRTKAETVKREAVPEKKENQEKALQTTSSPQKTTVTGSVHPDSTNYLITGTKTTYTLQPGETLIMVSKRFYGSKDLWPYIAKHNRDQIKNPDKVPFGITLKIPELKKK